MAYIQRPLIIQSHIIRLCCPRTVRRTRSGPFARVQNRKLHTETVTDNDISRLASLPLHPLTLADLVNLSTLLPWAEHEIKTLEEEVKFTEVMADLVQTHANTISILARGFPRKHESTSSPKDVTRFLDEHLRARIGTRLIAEQHLSLHFSSQPHKEVMHESEENAGYIGVIDTKLKPATIVEHCANTVGEICELKYGVRPTVVINGEPDYTFAHVPVHLEYIITELLKNAFRATVESGMEREPIEVTIAPLPELLPEDTGEKDSEDLAKRRVENVDQGNADVASHAFTGLHGNAAAKIDSNILPLKHSTPGVTIRIRDRGGGISPDNLHHIWDYSFTTFNDDQASSTLSGSHSSHTGMDALNAMSGPGGDGAHSLAGLGYGLPLGRAYAEYFGGGIAVQSLWGWGTDVYLSLRGVGRVDGDDKEKKR
ncbi:hypothetical protein SNOG_05862 [Parastagonospora nodorum SN15]|uniref:Protein-serine/threonine kinase n=1 Tax=Phaeosphaeria nodorum (strain SN15 / ATCC MYA-4574 / FGSC 10173) TaxID=321614 RepID=Q0UQV2_PHANO|nr:hypothetical protein SNOG_05862 [Parastagonospora nodorum SN15]EAT86926.1 hypothetical protein SNOG_05862 [Parastagonospora nodorum SN15]